MSGGTRGNTFQRYRGCERKRWFRTQAKAESAIANMATYVYHCKYCDGWHLATKREKDSADGYCDNPRCGY